MFQRYQRYFLGAYDTSDYLLQARARLLLIFLSMILGGVVLIQLAMLSVGVIDFIRTVVVTSPMMISIIVSLVLLRMGKYLFSANLFIAFASMTVAAGVVMHTFVETNLLYSSYIYFIFPCVIMCTIFSTQSFLAVVTVFFIALQAGVYMSQRGLGDAAYQKMITLAMIDTIFALVFIYIISLLITRIFQRNTDLARRETDKSRRQNEFIRNILREGSVRLVDSVKAMSGKLDGFSLNTQHQAAAVEEVTATMEEVSAGIDSIAIITVDQNKMQSELVSVLEELSRDIMRVDAVIQQTLSRTDDVAGKAREGEKSLLSMSESMGRIQGSSGEMTNILSIINDISDQINLLSLNAAIEAARAGDAGRGFAVVADEISKLADRTSSSLREIETLIKNNEAEIRQGMDSVTVASNTIGGIIEGVNAIDGMIRGMVDFARNQMETNRNVNNSTNALIKRSEEIRTATVEQKNAVTEVVGSVSDINQLAQSNSAGSEEMAQEAQKLLSMVNQFNSQLENYRDDD